MTNTGAKQYPRQHWKTSSSEQLRNLFAITLTTCNVYNLRILWEKFGEDMTEDIFARLHQNNVSDYIVIFNEILILQEDKCPSICSETLLQFIIICFLEESLWWGIHQTLFFSTEGIKRQCRLWLINERTTLEQKK